MLILLSPAKTQDFVTPPPVKQHTQPRLLRESGSLSLNCESSPRKISELMGVSEKIAALNHERYRSFHPPFTLQNARQAVFAFKGDVYTGLEAQTMDKSALSFAQAHVRILSGLYGVLRPLDLIQPYRLEMKTRLPSPRGRDLYKFWGSQLTDLLRKDLAAMELKLVVNLASEEYAKAVNLNALDVPVITPQFKEKQATGYKMIGLFAKQARGRMARYICDHHTPDGDALRFFAEDGYRLNIALSNPASRFIRGKERAAPQRPRKQLPQPDLLAKPPKIAKRQP